MFIRAYLAYKMSKWSHNARDQFMNVIAEFQTCVLAQAAPHYDLGAYQSSGFPLDEKDLTDILDYFNFDLDYEVDRDHYLIILPKERDE